MRTVTALADGLKLASNPSIDTSPSTRATAVSQGAPHPVSPRTTSNRCTRPTLTLNAVRVHPSRSALNTTRPSVPATRTPAMNASLFGSPASVGAIVTPTAHGNRIVTPRSPNGSTQSGDMSSDSSSPHVPAALSVIAPPGRITRSGVPNRISITIRNPNTGGPPVDNRNITASSSMANRPATISTRPGSTSDSSRSVADANDASTVSAPRPPSAAASFSDSAPDPRACSTRVPSSPFPTGTTAPSASPDRSTWNPPNDRVPFATVNHSASGTSRSITSPTTPPPNDGRAPAPPYRIPIPKFHPPPPPDEDEDEDEDEDDPAPPAATAAATSKSAPKIVPAPVSVTDLAPSDTSTLASRSSIPVSASYRTSASARSDPSSPPPPPPP
eukprot:Sspe_Gene.3926::Locus_1308_Transcript_2_2_Confidence_0.667_Length_2391::g.3926::m.3926